ncbi:MAG: hypothetical protein ACPGWR_32495 [Ardenticatenaceae bacterium]
MSSQSYTWKNRPSAVRAILVTIFAILVVAYVSIAIGTGDYLWFLQSALEDPERIVINFEGQAVTLKQNDANFQDVSNALKVTMSNTYGFAQNVGLSDETLQDYRAHYWSVEAFYAQPVRLHSRFRFGELRQIILPLSGRHSDQNILFLGQNEQFYTGPSLKSTTELQRTLREYDLAP